MTPPHFHSPATTESYTLDHTLTLPDARPFYPARSPLATPPAHPLLPRPLTPVYSARSPLATPPAHPCVPRPLYPWVSRPLTHEYPARSPMGTPPACAWVRPLTPEYPARSPLGAPPAHTWVPLEQDQAHRSLLACRHQHYANHKCSCGLRYDGPLLENRCFLIKRDLIPVTGVSQM